MIVQAHLVSKSGMEVNQFNNLGHRQASLVDRVEFVQ
jgi:hypothetical protein